MKFLKTIVWISILLSAGALAQERPVMAVIVEVSGVANLQQAGEASLAAQPLMKIYNGAVLDVKAGSLVEAYSVADGRRYEAIGPCTVRVEGFKANVLKGRKNAVRWIESAGKGDLIDPSHLPQRGRQDQRIKLNFASTKESLTFSWDTTLKGPYWIRVFTARDGEVDEVLWSTQTKDREIRYSGPPLRMDRSYVWQVAADKTLSSARFRIYSGGALDTFQRAEEGLKKWGEEHPDDPAVHVVMALMYDQHDQPQKALAALREAEKRQTDAVHQQALDLRKSQLLHETSNRAREHSYTILPYFMGAGYYGRYNQGYSGWGGYPSRWFY